jgi:hypothetical protein
MATKKAVKATDKKGSKEVTGKADELDEVEVEEEEEEAPKETKKAKKAEAETEAKAEAKAEAPKSKASKSSREPSSQAKVYQPANSYEVGEQIYHPVWKVEGTVVEVAKTEDGHGRIVVDFPELGVKKLVAEHQLKI